MAASTSKSSKTPSSQRDTMPPGLQTIYSACCKLYPEQPNPLQVTAVVKYWMGGPDPLDYISMYANPGNKAEGIPAHWHYVSFGLSDLHGNGRVHEISTPDGDSGFGFELTFRLKREPTETAPPTWPAALMQGLARYVFQSGNSLYPGDHIPWNFPLDSTESRIQHMLISEDVQLQSITGPLGSVSFMQIVGVCAEELNAAQHWNGLGVLELMKTVPTAGGRYLLTDMRRGESIFEFNPNLQDQLDRGIEEEGSNLSGVTGRCLWEDASEGVGLSREQRDTEKDRYRYPTEDHDMSPYDKEQIINSLKAGLLNTRSVIPPITSNNSDQSKPIKQEVHRKESFDSTVSSDLELLHSRTCEDVMIQLHPETAAVLPLAIKGRLKHGRHFTFKNAVMDCAITLVPPKVVGSLVSEQCPYCSHGTWLQVLINDDLATEMIEQVEELSNIEQIELPKVYSWPSHHLQIVIASD